MHRIRTGIFAIVFVLICGIAAAAQPFAYGVGVSAKADPAAAGDEAAAAAKAGLGGAPAKFLIVAAPEGQMVPELIDAIAKHFDRKLIYGHVSWAPNTHMGNFSDDPDLAVKAGVNICAIGGDIDVVVEVQATDPDAEDGYYDSGLALGERLKPVLEKNKRPGVLILTAGDQLNTVNPDFAAGLQDGLEEHYPILGGASGNYQAKEIVAGKVVNGYNICAAIMGDFGIGMSLYTGEHKPESGKIAMEQALADGKEFGKPFFAIISDCLSRRQSMQATKNLDQEHKWIKETLGTDFFGNYVHGEIGCRGKKERAEGVGFSLSTVVFFELQ